MPDSVAPQKFDPFAQGELEFVYQPTEPQKEIWASIAIGGTPANCAYNESICLELLGEVDVSKFHSALLQVVAAHDALRSLFSADGSKVCVFRHLDPLYHFVDLTQSSDQSVDEYRKRAVSDAFDLVRGPLLRVHLLKESLTRYVAVFSAHHIICDGWSMGILLEDLGSAYSALVEEKNVQLAAPRFSQYAMPQQHRLQSGALQISESYWVEKYRHSVPVYELPTDLPRPMLRSYTSRRVDYLLEEAKVTALKKLGARQGASFVATLFATFSAWLARITDSEDLAIGMPAAGQAISNQMRLIGHCVNMLPVRTAIDFTVPFTEHLAQTKKTLYEVYDHQELTFGRLLQLINVKRDPGRVPLIPVTFNFDKGLTELHFVGTDARIYSNPRSSETFELALNAAEQGREIVFELQYNADLFSAESIRNRLEGYARFIEAILENPQAILGEIDLLTADERTRVLSTWNDTFKSDSIPVNLVDLVMAQAIKTPEGIALRDGRGELTYSALLERISQYAHVLAGQGVQEGDLVGICLHRSLNIVPVILGVLRAGATYVPLDPEFPAERLQYMAEHAQLKMVLSESSIPTELFGGAGKVIAVDDADFQNLLKQHTTPFPAIPINPEQLAYVIYTSGSTGKPKGVAIPHRAVGNFLLAMAEQPGLKASDRLAAVTTLSFDIAVLELFLPLIVGACVYIVSREVAINGPALADLLEQEKITCMQATPATWRLLEACKWPGKPGFKAVCGGEALPHDLALWLLGKTEELWNMYGPTETTVWSTCLKVDATTPVGSIGQPIRNTSTYVVDRYRQPVPPGGRGELLIGGEGVARGYLHRLDLSSERFIANPFWQETGENLLNKVVYRTGDVVRWLSDGTIQYFNRIDNQVKIRGYRIELGEIEAALSKIPGITQSTVIVREDRPNDQRLAAYYLAEDGVDVSTLEIKRQLKLQLPAYMVPSDFILLQEFPLTPNNKIDRKRLPRPVPADTASQTPTEEPHNDFERSLLAVWRKNLGNESIGMSDNFFEHGGHSLLALSLINEVKVATNIEISYQSVFLYPTLRELADSLGTVASKSASSVVPLQNKGNGTPLFCLCGINLYQDLARALGENQPVYAIYADEEQALLNKAVQGEVADVSIARLAEVYSHAIRRKQPTGPYQLAGISFGGILALESAKLLQDQGETVHLVVLLDTILQKGQKSKTFGSIKKQLQRVKDGRFDLITAAAKKSLSRFGCGVRQSPTVVIHNEESAIRYRELAYLQAQHQYEESIRPYSGKVLLIRAEDHLEESAVEYLADYGWGRHLHGEFKVFDVPGNHLGIVQPPNVERLAEVVKPFLL